MKTNEGAPDRGLRIAAGLALIGLADAMLKGRERMARPELVG